MRRPVAKSRRSPGPFPYYGASGVVDYIDAYLFDEPLVLVGEDGAKWSSGQPTAFSVSGQTWVNNHAHVLRPDRTVIVDAWVIASLTDADIQPFVTGLTVPKLNQANLRSIAIPLPPISEQRRIVSHLGAQMQATERLRDAAREKLAAVEAVSAALLREAFAL